MSAITWAQTTVTSHTLAEKLGPLSTAAQVEPHLNLISVPWVLMQLHRSYSKMVVLPTQTATSQDKLERKKPSYGMLIARMWTCQPHLPQKNWWKHLSPRKQAKPQDQMIFTPSLFCMQEMLQPSGCASIWLPVWKDVKSLKSSTRQLSSPSES